MTYSIVARDPQTGALGAAVQSHWFSVGSVVTWAESGVGAIATQAFAEVSYGPLGLELLRGGKTPEQVLAALTSVDEARDRRQVAVLAASGEVATHTGTATIADAGHLVGDGVSVQANMMRRDTVPQAMLDAWLASDGPLPLRLLAALDAAEAEGGDIRGMQSASMLIVAEEPSGRPWADRLLDLRVEDHARPLQELRRLVELHAAYERMGTADELLVTDGVDAAAAAYAQAREAVPTNTEMSFWHGLMLAEQGELAGAREALALARGEHDGWGELLRRLPAAGLLADDLVEPLLRPR